MWFTGIKIDRFFVLSHAIISNNDKPYNATLAKSLAGFMLNISLFQKWAYFENLSQLCRKDGLIWLDAGFFIRTSEHQYYLFVNCYKIKAGPKMLTEVLRQA